MSDRRPAARIYRAVSELVLGRELSDDRLDDMAEVFTALWQEASGHPANRCRLVCRELAGLIRTRNELRAERSRRTGAIHWTWGDEMGEVWRDLKLAMRVLFRSPVATAAAVATLALGIGGTTAVYSVADRMLLHPMNFAESDRLVLVLSENAEGGAGLLSYDNFRDLQSEVQALDALALWRGNSIAVTGLGDPERIRGEFVSSSYFEVLGETPALGRAIGPGEDVPGGERTAVLSHGYWQRRFASDPGVLGQVLNMNSIPHTIVGVMPPGFRSYWDQTEAWISLHTSPGTLNRANQSFFGIGRRAEGANPDAVDAELDQIMARLAEAYPDVNAGGSMQVRDLATWVVGDDRRTLILSLLGAIVLVLIIATGNVANLQLARASLRSREMVIRSALGGGRSRLLSQLLVENLTLAALGGLLGMAVAQISLSAFLATGSSPFATFDIVMSRSALAVAAVVTLGVGTLAGILPALRGSSVRPSAGLREATRGGSDGRATNRFRSALVVGQTAMAVTLLVGASLLLRTAGALGSVDVGFDAANLLTGETRLTAESYQDDETRRVYLEQVVSRLAAIPGARGSTLIAGMPFSGDGGSIPVRAEGSELDFDEAPRAFTPTVAHGYFAFMGIPVLAGRTFETTDGPEAEFVLVPSRALVDRLYPGEDAVGRMIETPEGAARIIGVVEDSRRTLTAEIEPTLYVHYLQSPPSLFSVLIRTESEPMSYERALREAFWSVDSNQPLWEIAPLESRMEGYFSNETFLSIVLSCFAGLALLLAAVGTYGVMAHSVGRRRQELGIRMALGAEEGLILRMVLRQGMTLTVVGALLGVIAAAGLARILASVIFGVGLYDPLSFAVAPAVLLSVALLATYLPARRATRVDPKGALQAS